MHTQGFGRKPRESRSFPAGLRRRERPERGARDGDGPPRKRRETRSDLATYRIAVGKRHKAMPGAIVGAIANEGGLHRSDFGHIDIRLDYSLVELPANLSKDTLKKLSKTRIQGQLIEIQPDRGPKPHRGKPKSK